MILYKMGLSEEALMEVCADAEIIMWNDQDGWD